MKNVIKIFILACIFYNQLATAQNNREMRTLFKDSFSPEELVSISKTLPLDKALSLFNDFSKKYYNKIMVYPKDTNSIGIDIENMYWYQAFEEVLRKKNYWYEEQEEYFKIFPVEAEGTTTTAGVPIPTNKIDSVAKSVFKKRDIKISTVFFNIDVNKSLNTGINWNYLYSGDTTGGPTTKFGAKNIGNLTTGGTTGSGGSQQQNQNNFVGTFIPALNFANLTAFISFFQKNSLGDVISRPNVVVTSGNQGKIQVGKDIFITTKDIANNNILKPVSTGIIITVTPTYYESNGNRFIDLDIAAENSSGDATGGIAKSAVTTKLVLIDKEEAVLGGLYSTSIQKERGGIPFLKDLPWWVLGLRYVFGYDADIEIKQELIILLKAEVVPTIEERIANKLRENESVIAKERKINEDEIKKIRNNTKKK